MASNFPQYVVALMTLALLGCVAVRDESYARASLMRSDLLAEAPAIVQPGLGWGTSPAGDQFTSPLCFREHAGGITGVVSTSTKLSVKRTDVKYKTDSELTFALKADVGGLAGMSFGQLNMLKGAVGTLLSNTQGRLHDGLELHHITYALPVVRYTISDPMAACQSTVVQQLATIARCIQDGDASCGYAHSDVLLSNFMQIHGTQVVTSVVLGGELNLYYTKKTKGGDIDIMSQSGNFSMMSEDTQMTVFGGTLGPFTDSADMDGSLGKAVDAWADSVRAGTNLVVMDMDTVPLQMLLDVSLQSLVQRHSRNAIKAWMERIQVAELLEVLDKQLVEQREAYDAARTWSGQIDAMESVTRLAPRYCEQCLAQSVQYSSGFVGLHVTPPSACKHDCQKQLTWLCKVAVRELSVYMASTPTTADGLMKVFGYRPDAKPALKNARRLCRMPLPVVTAGLFEDKPHTQDKELTPPSDYGAPPTTTETKTEPNEGEDTTDKPSLPSLPAEPVPAKPAQPDSGPAATQPAESAQATGLEVVDDATTLVTPGLGWAMLPVSDDFTMPICGSTAAQVETNPNEPVQPTISVYSSDMELKLALSGGIANAIPNPVAKAAVGALLKNAGGSLAQGYRLVHAQYYVPVKVKTLQNPMRDCQSRELQELVAKQSAGALTNHEIDRYLLVHGTRLVTSIVLGGRLDFFNVQNTRDVDLKFMSNVSLAKLSMDTTSQLSVVGGLWNEEGSETLQMTVQRWLASVQTSANLAVLGETTMPLTAVLPPALFLRARERMDMVTAAFMNSITVMEEVAVLQSLVQTARTEYEAGPDHLQRVNALQKIADSLREHCAASKTLALLFDRSIVRGSDAKTPASAELFCTRTRLWVCEVVVPAMTAILPTRRVDHYATENALRAASFMCTSIEANRTSAM